MTTARWVDRLLFSARGPSADRVVPELQDLSLGTFVPDGSPETGCGFHVVVLDPERALVLRSTSHLPTSWRDPARAQEAGRGCGRSGWIGWIGGRRVPLRMRAAVAATGTWTDPDGIRSPSGEVHAWLPSTNQTLCGLSLHRSQLLRFPHVDWVDVQPATGRDADRVAAVCPRCAAGMGRRRDERRWSRDNPRP